MKMLDEQVFDQLFYEGRTFSHWQDIPVDPDLIREAIACAGLAPTSANTQPARYVVISSAEGRARLKPYLAPGNVEKTMTAPATVIIGHDLTFYEALPRMFPQVDAKSWFVGNTDLIAETAFRNGCLQGGYFILAARAVGLDCGPMSGFDVDGVTREFFAGTEIRANFLCNLGYGDRDTLHPRNPRFDPDEVATFV